MQLNQVVAGYVNAMLWTEELDCLGLDIDDFSTEAQKQIREDCQNFIELAQEWLTDDDAHIWDTTIGFDFWLTRNHYGSGFWDHDYVNQTKLTEIAHTFGEAYLIDQDIPLGVN